MKRISILAPVCGTLAAFIFILAIFGVKGNRWTTPAELVENITSSHSSLDVGFKVSALVLAVLAGWGWRVWYVRNRDADLESGRAAAQHVTERERAKHRAIAEGRIWPPPPDM